MIQYSLNVQEINYLASLILRDIHSAMFIGAGEAKRRWNLLHKVTSQLQYIQKHPDNFAFLGIQMAEKPEEYIPPSEENLAPNGSEIMDAPLTEEEVEEAIRQLESKKKLTCWRLIRRW